MINRHQPTEGDQLAAAFTAPPRSDNPGGIAKVRDHAADAIGPLLVVNRIVSTDGRSGADLTSMDKQRYRDLGRLGGQKRIAFRGTFGRQIWRPAATRAELPDVTFHTVRHSFVAILVAAGCNVREVSQWPGHHSVAFTLTRYGGLFDDSTDAAVNRLDHLLSDDDMRP